MTEIKRTLALDSDGDFLLDDNNRFVMLSGRASVVQELKITLKTIRGEDPFAPNHGLRLFDVIGAPNEVLEREFRSALNRDDRVQSIEEIEISEPDGSRSRDVAIAVELVEFEDPVAFTTRID